jgi:hypothetical protein
MPRSTPAVSGEAAVDPNDEQADAGVVDRCREPLDDGHRLVPSRTLAARRGRKPFIALANKRSVVVDVIAAPRAERQPPGYDLASHRHPVGHCAGDRSG